MERTYRPGELAYVNGKPVLIVRQVLFNHPAYRVRALPTRRQAIIEEWVVDGIYVSTDPSHRAGLLAAPPAASLKPDAA